MAKEQGGRPFVSLVMGLILVAGGIAIIINAGQHTIGVIGGGVTIVVGLAVLRPQRHVPEDDRRRAAPVLHFLKALSGRTWRPSWCPGRGVTRTAASAFHALVGTERQPHQIVDVQFAEAVVFGIRHERRGTAAQPQQRLQQPRLAHPGDRNRRQRRTDLRLLDVLLGGFGEQFLAHVSASAAGVG